VIACSALLDTAHVFCGAEVPAASIAYLAIAPQARGHGLARPMMDALCKEARRRGALMVSLFASARPVYRQCGFELAGDELVYEAETAALPSGSRVEFKPLSVGDDRIKAAYDKKVAVECGLLRRTNVHWAELTREPKHALAAYGVGDDRLRAYVIADAGDTSCLDIRDWYAESGEMAEAILCFIGRFRSVYPKARWHGAPQDDIVAAMPDKGWRLAHQEEWLARILEPASALERRRYLIRSAELGIRIGETETHTAIRLTIASGEAKASLGSTEGSPTVAVRASAFASLFTGFCSASRLARRGNLFGDPDAVQLCDLVFAGPRPWVAEHF
jgi:predicted acetyltransferase